MTEREADTAVVLMAYGTPTSRDEIEPYYTDIRRGRPPTTEQLADLVRRYDAIGGLSPLAARTEAQRVALATALDTRSSGRFEVVLGLKHASPLIEQAAADVLARGIRRIVGLVLAPHYSAFSVGQYLDRLRTAAEPGGADVRGIESWATTPAYVSFLAVEIRQHLDAMPPGTQVLFTAHSLPERILTTGDPYPSELRSTAELVAAALGLPSSVWSIAWQSAGRTPEPWLGPDILAAMTDLAGEGAPGVLVCPCGFVSDHLEVLYDLDIEAARHATTLGIAFARTASVNDDATVMGALADRVVGAAA